jgi:AraC-like DNA-binding protein
VHDSRYTPPAKTPPTGRAVLQFVLGGALQPSNVAARMPAPALWLMSQDDVEGAEGRRNATVRSTGQPFTSLLLQCKEPLPVLGGVAPSPPIQLDAEPALLEQARAYAQAVLVEAGDSEVQMAAADRLVATATQAGLLPSALSDDEAHDATIRIWRGLQVILDRADLGAALGQLSDLAALSTRHTNRAIDRWAADWGMPADGFRRTNQRWRLTVAVLLLSNLRNSRAEVARVAGYGHPSNLTSALLAAGLPAPTRLRELLRDG